MVKRYGTPLYPIYITDAIEDGHLDRLRFALSQGQEVSGECYKMLTRRPDAAFLNEVLLARKVGGSIPEADCTLIKQALRESYSIPYTCVTEVLAEYSIFD